MTIYFIVQLSLCLLAIIPLGCGDFLFNFFQLALRRIGARQACLDSSQILRRALGINPTPICPVA